MEHVCLASLDPVNGVALMARPEPVEGRIRAALGLDLGAQTPPVALR
jgi:hypothetical protein